MQEVVEEEYPFLGTNKHLNFLISMCENKKDKTMLVINYIILFTIIKTLDELKKINQSSRTHIVEKAADYWTQTTCLGACGGQT